MLARIALHTIAPIGSTEGKRSFSPVHDGVATGSKVRSSGTCFSFWIRLVFSPRLVGIATRNENRDTEPVRGEI